MVFLMSKTARKRQPKRLHKPKNRTTAGIVSGIINRGSWGNEVEKPITGKIIFLGKENLEKLRGYKAFLDLWSDGEASLTITGLNPQRGRVLFDSMDKMKDEEIHGK
jgi:hypothetical protein